MTDTVTWTCGECDRTHEFTPAYNGDDVPVGWYCLEDHACHYVVCSLGCLNRFARSMEKHQSSDAVDPVDGIVAPGLRATQDSSSPTTFVVPEAESGPQDELYRELLLWLDDRDINDQFERIGEKFYAETGFLRPGKAEPIDMCGGEEHAQHRQKAWRDWCAQWRLSLIERLSAALLVPAQPPIDTYKQKQDALRLLLPAIPQGADWHANRYDTDNSLVLKLWRATGDEPKAIQFDCAKALLVPAAPRENSYAVGYTHGVTDAASGITRAAERHPALMNPDTMRHIAANVPLWAAYEQALRSMTGSDEIAEKAK